MIVVMMVVAVIVAMMVVAMQKSGDLDRDCGYDGGCDGYEKNIDCLEDAWWWWWLVMVVLVGLWHQLMKWQLYNNCGGRKRLLLGKRGKDSDKMFTTHTNESCDDLHAPVTVMNIKMNMITRLQKLDVKASFGTYR